MLKRGLFFLCMVGLSVAPSKSAFAYTREEEPALDASAVQPATELYQRQFSDRRTGYDYGSGVKGGMVYDIGAGGRYYATGNTLAKYSHEGALLWVRFHENHIVNVESGGLSQQTYYESWDDGGDNIPLGSTLDSGEVTSPYAQKMMIDGDSIYVCFQDTYHRDRSVLVKFDADGVVQWRQVTSAPYQTEETASWNSRVLELRMTPQGPAVFEVVTTGSAVNTRTRLVIFKELAAAGGDRQGEIHASYTYGAPTLLETRPHHSVGIGMVVDSETDDIYLGTHDGPPTDNPDDPAAQPSQIVLRKLAAPYDDEGEVLHTEASLSPAEQWFDLNATGDVLTICGTLTTDDVTSNPLVLAFATSDFSPLWEAVIPVDAYLDNVGDANGTRLLFSGDSIYVTSAPGDLRGGDSAPDLALTKLDLETGDVIWTKYEYGRVVWDVAPDLSGNIYYLGPGDGGSFKVFKISDKGILQFDYVKAPTVALQPYIEFHGEIYSAGAAIFVAVGRNSALGSDPIIYAPVFKLTNPANSLRNQTIEFVPLPASVPRGSQYEVKAYASSELEVSYSIVSGNATIDDDNIVTFTGSGTVVLRASQGGNEAYNPAPSVTQTITVKGHSQLITFGSLPDRSFTTAPISLAASSSSGLTVSFSVSGAAKKTAANKIALTGLGLVHVTATQAGNYNYTAASPVTRSFRVTDKIDPTCKVESSITSTTDKTKVPVKVSDNHIVAKVRYRIKLPGKSYGGFNTFNINSPVGGSDSFAIIVTTKTEGSYAVEVTPIDKAGNTGRVRVTKIDRR